jgi:hypothetical protein
LLVTTDYRLPITDYLVAGLPQLRLGELRSVLVAGYHRLPIHAIAGCWFTSASPRSSLRSVLVAGCWLPPITDYRLPITWLLVYLGFTSVSSLRSLVTSHALPDAGRRTPPHTHTSFFEI